MPGRSVQPVRRAKSRRRHPFGEMEDEAAHRSESMRHLYRNGRRDRVGWGDRNGANRRGTGTSTRRFNSGGMMLAAQLLAFPAATRRQLCKNHQHPNNQSSSSHDGTTLLIRNPPGPLNYPRWDCESNWRPVELCEERRADWVIALCERKVANTTDRPHGPTGRRNRNVGGANAKLFANSRESQKPLLLAGGGGGIAPGAGQQLPGGGGHAADDRGEQQRLREPQPRTGSNSASVTIARSRRCRLMITTS